MQKFLITALILAFAAPAVADTTPCPEVPKIKKKGKKRPPTAPYCKVLVGPPGKPGMPGPKGDAGRDGKDGKDGRVGKIEVVGDTKFPLDLGVFGTAMGKHGDWAWGPALQVRGDVRKDYEMALMGGLAMGATGDRESGYTVRLGVARKNERATLGIGAGVLKINGSPDNGEIDARYLMLDATISLREKLGPVYLQLNLAPIVLSMLHDDTDGNAQFSIGSSVSLFGSVRF